LLVIYAAVAACDQPSQKIDGQPPRNEKVSRTAGRDESPKPSLHSEAISCKGADCRILTPDGWAGIRAGMPLEAALRASGLRLIKPGHYDEFFADEPERLTSCNIYRLAGAPSNISVLVEDGIITSIGVELSAEPGGAMFRTDKGVALGASEAAVRRAYKIRKEEPNIYSEPPDKELFAQSAGGNGIKFSIVDGKVLAINVGGRSIEYVEGCL
jgi:hypothetical protein